MADWLLLSLQVQWHYMTQSPDPKHIVGFSCVDSPCSKQRLLPDMTECIPEVESKDRNFSLDKAKFLSTQDLIQIWKPAMVYD